MAVAGMSVLAIWKTLPVVADDDSPADARMLGKCVDTKLVIALYVCKRGSSNFLS
jgi:hypothetical protein